MTVAITLPDGSVRNFDSAPTISDIAASIGPGLAKAALAGRVDGRLVDTSHRIERDAVVAIVTERDADGLEVLRHSMAHLLAYAVKELFPEAQVTIGPVIESGFYYDFSYSRPFTPEDLTAIERKMAELAKHDPAGSLHHSSMAKLVASETAGRIVDRAVQIMGRWGLIKDSKIERLYRQARPMRIYEGASSVLRIGIARTLVEEEEHLWTWA